MLKAPIVGTLILNRSEVEKGDMPIITQVLGPRTPPLLLRKMAGSLIIAIKGYADTDSEIYEIPELRNYLRTKSELWSPWLFTGSIFSPDLMALVLACLPSITCWRCHGEIYVRWNNAEMKEFLRKSLPTAAWLHARAGIGVKEGSTLLKATAAYLGISEPPRP